MTTMSNRETHFMKLHEWIPLNKLDWKRLSRNPNTISILEKNLNKVDWSELSSNPNAIHILEKNLDKMNWEELSRNPNPNAIHLLEKNLDKVTTKCWRNLSLNPNIFTYDYKAMKDRMFRNGGIKEDLMKNRFHPQNLYKFKWWGFDGPDDDDLE